MKLSKLAKRNIISVGPGDSFDKAICLMEEHHIHHLPVMNDGNLVGMLSDRDLLMAVGWKLEVDRTVDSSEPSVVGPTEIQEIMSKPALYLAPDNEAHTAIRMMVEGKFHAFPLIHGGILVGMVTSTDILSGYCDKGHNPTVHSRLQERVGDRMRVNVRTVGLREPLHVAARILREEHIRHLPVTSDDKLLGIISDRDIRRACGEETIEDDKAQARGEFYIGATSVIQVMSKKVETISEDATLIEANRKMVDRQVSCLPVTRDDRLVGILTDSDLLRLIAQIHEEDEHRQA